MSLLLQLYLLCAVLRETLTELSVMALSTYANNSLCVTIWSTEQHSDYFLSHWDFQYKRKILCI